MIKIKNFHQDMIGHSLMNELRRVGALLKAINQPMTGSPATTYKTKNDNSQNKAIYITIRTSHRKENLINKMLIMLT